VRSPVEWARYNRVATSLALEGLEPTDAVGSVFAGGEESALREAYDSHSKLIYAFCRRSISGDRAMDVIQELFLSAWRAHGAEVDRIGDRMNAASVPAGPLCAFEAGRRTRLLRGSHPHADRRAHQLAARFRQEQHQTRTVDNAHTPCIHTMCRGHDRDVSPSSTSVEPRDTSPTQPGRSVMRGSLITSSEHGRTRGAQRSGAVKGSGAVVHPFVVAVTYY
jgi:hypothetical protein